MTAALALSANVTELPAVCGKSSPAVEASAPTSDLSFDGLLAEVAQELLAEHPELDVAKPKESQTFLALESGETDVPIPDEADWRLSGSAFSPDSAALRELDDTRHVFLASVDWTPSPRASHPAPVPVNDSPSETVRVAPMEMLALQADDSAASLASISMAEPVTISPIIQLEQALNAVQGDLLGAEELVPDELDGPVTAAQEVDAPKLLKRIDPVQFRALDTVALAEPVLVSVDTMDAVEPNPLVDISAPTDTPELPVAPMDLDVVRVDIDDNLAVEVRAVDGEVDVALLGADAVKPVMKGVQAELRDSLKRGGYDLGQFERSEQDQAERRNRRRQHQHQERRDHRRGALL